MSKQLLDELAQLTLEQSSLRRTLDVYYYNKTARHNAFKRMQEIEDRISKIKYDLRMERLLKNEESGKSIRR